MAGFDDLVNFIIPKAVLIAGIFLLWKAFEQPFGDMGSAFKKLFGWGKDKAGIGDQGEGELVEVAPDIVRYE